MGEETKLYIQTVSGKFLWYAQAVNGVMLTALSALTAHQSKSMHKMMKRVKQFLIFCESQEPAIITYLKSVIILATHSDAGSLNESQARSIDSRCFYLSENVEFLPNNNAIHNYVEIIKAVMSSAV